MFVLRGAQRARNTQIATEVGCTTDGWVVAPEFRERGLSGSETAPRRGRLRDIKDAEVQRVLAMTSQTPPGGGALKRAAFG